MQQFLLGGVEAAIIVPGAPGLVPNFSSSDESDKIELADEADPDGVESVTTDLMDCESTVGDTGATAPSADSRNETADLQRHAVRVENGDVEETDLDFLASAGESIPRRQTMKDILEDRGLADKHGSESSRKRRSTSPVLDISAKRRREKTQDDNDLDNPDGLAVGDPLGSISAVTTETSSSNGSRIKAESTSNLKPVPSPRVVHRSSDIRRVSVVLPIHISPICELVKVIEVHMNLKRRNQRRGEHLTWTTLTAQVETRGRGGKDRYSIGDVVCLCTVPLSSRAAAAHPAPPTASTSVGPTARICSKAYTNLMGLFTHVLACHASVAAKMFNIPRARVRHVAMSFCGVSAMNESLSDASDVDTEREVALEEDFDEDKPLKCFVDGCAKRFRNAGGLDGFHKGDHTLPPDQPPADFHCVSLVNSVLNEPPPPQKKSGGATETSTAAAPSEPNSDSDSLSERTAPTSDVDVAAAPVVRKQPKHQHKQQTRRLPPQAAASRSRPNPEPSVPLPDSVATDVKSTERIIATPRLPPAAAVAGAKRPAAAIAMAIRALGESPQKDSTLVSSASAKRLATPTAGANTGNSGSSSAGTASKKCLSWIRPDQTTEAMLVAPTAVFRTSSATESSSSETSPSAAAVLPLASTPPGAGTSENDVTSLPQSALTSIAPAPPLAARRPTAGTVGPPAPLSTQKKKLVASTDDLERFWPFACERPGCGRRYTSKGGLSYHALRCKAGTGTTSAGAGESESLPGQEASSVSEPKSPAAERGTSGTPLRAVDGNTNTSRTVTASDSISPYVCQNASCGRRYTSKGGLAYHAVRCKAGGAVVPSSSSSTAASPSSAKAAAVAIPPAAAAAAAKPLAVPTAAAARGLGKMDVDVEVDEEDEDDDGDSGDDEEDARKEDGADGDSSSGSTSSSSGSSGNSSSSSDDDDDDKDNGGDGRDDVDGDDSGSSSDETEGAEASDREDDGEDGNADDSTDVEDGNARGGSDGAPSGL
ncbi:hypothetical protein DFJ73DRAFT_855913 [Zopfochytrium polystomum]|nr:hypothetical protein DFJ73DRAFT_855913 [Zopfochytrium polystomum]